MISTRDLSLLPDIERLRMLLQSMATLEAIICRDSQNRYYTFNAAWAVGEQVGSMRNGSGDEYYAHFGPAGCWIKGFAHESPMSPYREDPLRPWPGVLDAVPDIFADCSKEPAFDVESVTFCIWRQRTDKKWQIGPIIFPPGYPDPDGSELLLSSLDGRPESYRDWASDYYGQDVDLAAVKHVYQQNSLTPETAVKLNPDVEWSELTEDIAEIGYPVTDAVSS